MTSKITSKNWTKVASKLFKSLAKVANDELAIANGEAPAVAPENGVQPEVVAPEEGAATAGPQEVVDAIEVIVSELEEVQEAIPAEPTQELDEDPTAEPAVEPQVQAEPAAVEEEKIEVAKLKTQVAVLTKRLEQQDLQKSAETYAQLYDGTKVQETKFQEVIKSGKNAEHWDAKIAAIEEYRSIQGTSVNSSQQGAATVTNWITPRSKVAKQQVGNLTHL